MSRFPVGMLFLLTELSVAYAGEVRFERKTDWDEWAFPVGALVQNDNGSIGLSRVEKSINSVADAREFSHTIKSSKQPVPGGIRIVGSGQETADLVMDGRDDTWWQPSTEDRLGFWWVEVDLGRMVLASKIRLTFPDTLGVRPFRNFSVYVNDGVRATAAKDVFRFSRIGRTTEPNEARVIEYDLNTIWPGAATGDNLVIGDTLAHRMVQYIRFVAEELQPDAALAEIVVETLGDNVVLGTVERGGGVRGGTDKTNLLALVDGDKNTKWTVSGSGDWISEGHWFEMDLGATFWIDRAFLYLTGGSRLSFEISTSDGTEATGLTSDRLRSGFDYQRLTLVDNMASPVRQIFDFAFAPRKVRYVFFNSTQAVYRQLNSISDLMFYGAGYVAEVEMVSDFIDLGGVKNIRRLSWDADLPPGTFVEIRSQTGDTFFIENKYYNKNGIEVSEAQWNKLPKSQKQPVLEIQRRGADWSGWSQVYAEPDAVFLSPSPRSFAQLQVKLGNDNPQLSPLLHNIVLDFDDALVSGGVSSRILPRQVGFDSLQTFRYVLTPEFRTGDQGFDQVVIRVPFPVEDVGLKIRGADAEPTAVVMTDDLLQVNLPKWVRRDSVELTFATRIRDNATVFDGWVGVAGEDLQQGIRPEDNEAATVFVPSVAHGDALIRRVAVSSVVSPNLDGVNDMASIRFALAKAVGREPEVSIYDLSGQRVRVVLPSSDGYAWDGRDENGQLLPSGIYLCQIKLVADVGDESAHRMVNLVY